MNNICVYCGSSSGKLPDYLESAVELAEVLAERNIGLVYGGASVGIMGKLADEMLGHGAQVIGVMPKSLVEKEVSHSGLTQLRVVDSMHERKSLMESLADGFIAMPGGIGTLEELFEVLTWSQLGFHKKPCALLNIAGYYEKLAEFLDHSVDQHFVKDIHRQSLIIDDDVNSVLNRMQNYSSLTTDKWMD